MGAADEFRYNRLTWPEMNDEIEMQKVVILPTGSTEQHGHHLPLDVDVFLCETVCHELAGADTGSGARVAAHRLRSEYASHRFPRNDPH